MSHRTIQTDDGCTSDPEKWLPRLHVYENRSLIELEGNFVAEDAGTILNQLIKDIRVFLKSNFVFRIEKYNTASLMAIWEILYILEYEFANKKIKVEWHYDGKNEDLGEDGEMLKDLHETLNLILIPH